MPIRRETVTLWYTSDGQSFRSEGEAAQHELVLGITKLIEGEFGRRVEEYASDIAKFFVECKELHIMELPKEP